MLASHDADFIRVSEKLGVGLIRQIASVAANGPALQRLLAEMERPTTYQNARGLQEDAVHLAVKAFGASVADSVALTGEATALATVRLHEDAVIEHDARWLPGWQLHDSDLTGTATFTKGREVLQVITANKRALEQLFGVDLIYLNKRRGSLVMVQYKLMDPGGRLAISDLEDTEEREWTIAIDGQFKDEIRRMRRFDRDLSPDGPYRLNSGAFFFKLLRRNASTSSSGVVLSLEHLDQMIAQGSAGGPRGGLRISYQGLDGHYLRGDPFVELVRSGYIGSRGATTHHLEALIQASLNGGRAVVAAIQASMGDEDDLFV